MSGEGLGQVIEGLAGVDYESMSPAELAASVVGLRRSMNRLEAEYARCVHAAERAGVWREAGATSMEAWLAGATNSTVRSARSQVQLADTLAAAPMVAEKIADGGMSLDNARLVGAVVGHEAFAADQDTVLELASGSPRDTRRGLEHWLALVDPAGQTDRDAELGDREHLRFTPDGHGMNDIAGKLTDASLAAVQTALGHIAGAAYADQTGRAQPKRIADALVELCRAYSAGEVTGGRERPKLLVTVPFETVTERAAARGVVIGTELTVSGDEARRMACDAEIHRVITSGRSTILDFGHTTRLVSDSQFLALAVRDGGCRWPGCTRPPQWCQAHHIDEVVRDDGPTNLDNLVLMCSFHHHLVHGRRWSLHGDAHDLRIRTPVGEPLDAPPNGHIPAARQLAFSA